MQDLSPTEELLLASSRPDLQSMLGDYPLTIYKQGIELLEAFLDRKVDDKKKPPLVVGLNRHNLPVLLPGPLREQTERVLRKCWTATTLPGRAEIEPALLRNLALTADPRSLPVFEQVLTLKIKGSLAPVRKQWGAAGIAWIARCTGDAAAVARVQELLRSKDLGSAIESTRLLLTPENDRPPTAAQWTTIEWLARDAPHAEQRWLANLVLGRFERPMLTHEGVYRFEVLFGDISRTIEVLCESTLDDLVLAILDSIGWDLDHLYQWQLSPHLDGPPFLASGAPPLALIDDEDLPADDIVLGTLRLAAGATLRLHYDFGEDHRFKVTLREHQPAASKKASYPRVVAKKGRAPKQDDGW
jgi:hypothetical protein